MHFLLTITSALLSLTTLVTALVNVTIESTDAQLRYNDNGGWRNFGACGTSTLTRKIGDSFSFTFNGTAVYFVGSISRIGGIITFDLDGNDTVVDRALDQTPLRCGVIMFNRTDLYDMEHTLVVTLSAASHPNNKPTSYLEFERIIYTFDDLGTVPGPPTNGTTPSPSGRTAARTSPPASTLVGSIVGGILGCSIVLFGFSYYMVRRRLGEQKQRQYRPTHTKDKMSFASPRRPSSAIFVAAVGKGRRIVSEKEFDFPEIVEAPKARRKGGYTAPRQ